MLGYPRENSKRHHIARYETYLIPGKTLIPGGRGSVSPWYWICVISRLNSMLGAKIDK